MCSLFLADAARNQGCNDQQYNVEGGQYDDDEEVGAGRRHRAAGSSVSYRQPVPPPGDPRWGAHGGGGGGRGGVVDDEGVNEGASHAASFPPPPPRGALSLRGSEGGSAGVFPAEALRGSGGHLHPGQVLSSIRGSGKGGSGGGSQGGGGVRGATTSSGRPSSSAAGLLLERILKESAANRAKGKRVEVRASVLRVMRGGPSSPYGPLPPVLCLASMHLDPPHPLTHYLARAP